jgi:hypothetical protein
MAEKLDEPKPAAAEPQVAVVDPHHIPVQYVDWIVTGGLGSHGILNLALAALDFTAMVDGKPLAIIQSRLRMSVSTATNLHLFLGDLLASAGSTPVVKPPSNVLN